MRRISFLINLSRPLYLLGGILLYSLGGGISKYLGVHLDWTVFFLGLVWIVLVQLGAHALYDYFEPLSDSNNQADIGLNRNRAKSEEERNDTLTRLIVFFTSLAIAGSVAVLLMQTAHLNPISGLSMIVVFTGGLLFSLPPVRLSNSGYGELVVSILFANVIPTLAFTLQTGELHRLLAMTTFPLTALLLAMIIAMEFPTYSRDMKLGRRQLLVRMGWQSAMNIHNLLIVSAFLLMAIALFFRMPIFIGGPFFLTIPLGALQIWQMKRIADGSKPNWSTLSISWIVLFFTAVYLLTYSYWIH